ncbi:MAG: hydrogenase maturation protease [Bacteroidales bacterium]|nr:hydrogenase maturation protease [Bacteroidales bacterium]
MPDLRALLNNPDLKVVLAGVGNLLRNDDGVGPYISNRLQTKKNRIIVTPEAGIDRYISTINNENPDLLIIIDCVEMGLPAGSWKVIPVSDVLDTTCHSHNVSLQKLSCFFNTRIFIIAIQPANIDVGEIFSPPVMQAASEIIECINN